MFEGSYNVGALYDGRPKGFRGRLHHAASSYVFVDGSKATSHGQSDANPLVPTIRKPSYPHCPSHKSKRRKPANIASAPVFAYRQMDRQATPNAMMPKQAPVITPCMWITAPGKWEALPGYRPGGQPVVTVAGAAEGQR